MGRTVDLTPVERIGDYWFKRDDLFAPFTDIPVNGGKVRQCSRLLNEAHDRIVKDFNSTVVIGTSISSSMGILAARIAREHGFRCVVFVGGTNMDSILERPKKYALQTNVLSVGGELNTDAKLGDYSTLDVQIAKWTESNGPAFQVKYSQNLVDYPDSILWSIAEQVQNLPDNLDVLLVPCGACITLSGILMGLEKYGKKVGKVIGVQIAGYDRTDDIESYLGPNHFPYVYFPSKDFPYRKLLKIDYNGLELDWVYEAKAFWYMENYLKATVAGKNVCVWVVGNSNLVRTNVY